MTKTPTTEVNAQGITITRIFEAPENKPFELVTVVFTDAGNGRTEMLFTQTGPNMPEAGYQQVAQGWNVFFDTLEEVVA